MALQAGPWNVAFLHRWIPRATTFTILSVNQIQNIAKLIEKLFLNKWFIINNVWTLLLYQYLNRTSILLFSVILLKGPLQNYELVVGMDRFKLAKKLNKTSSVNFKQNHSNGFNIQTCPTRFNSLSIPAACQAAKDCLWIEKPGWCWSDWSLPPDTWACISRFCRTWIFKWTAMSAALC